MQAALLTGPPASDAANRWLESHRHEAPNGFRSLEPASRRLLPLVYRNLKDGIDADIRRELRAVHHEYWAENQKLFRQLEILLQGLDRAGIPSMVLKGAALSVLHYRDMAARPMSDCDILVPEDFGPRLVRQYLRDGWTPDCIPPDAPGNSYFYRYRHALDLAHPAHGKVDLHWHGLLEATHRGADRSFWEGSVPLQVKSAGTRALNPTDQLLHVCLHGYSFNPMPPIRWIADAVTIMRTSVVDWQRMLRVAGELGVAIPCAEALEFLNAELGVDVPRETIAQLSQQPASQADRRFSSAWRTLARAAGGKQSRTSGSPAVAPIGTDRFGAALPRCRAICNGSRNSRVWRA